MSITRSFVVCVFLLLFFFLFEGASSPSECLGKAVLFYYDTPWGFNIPIRIILYH